MAHLLIAQLHVTSIDLKVLQVHFTPQTLLAPEHQRRNWVRVKQDWRCLYEFMYS
jgi:hypothetical protein